jgi:hypothetical protein
VGNENSDAQNNQKYCYASKNRPDPAQWIHSKIGLLHSQRDSARG